MGAIHGRPAPSAKKEAVAHRYGLFLSWLTPLWPLQIQSASQSLPVAILLSIGDAVSRSSLRLAPPIGHP